VQVHKALLEATRSLSLSLSLSGLSGESGGALPPSLSQVQVHKALLEATRALDMTPTKPVIIYIYIEIERELE
jgi:hypothetical protein